MPIIWFLKRTQTKTYKELHECFKLIFHFQRLNSLTKIYLLHWTTMALLVKIWNLFFCESWCVHVGCCICIRGVKTKETQTRLHQSSLNLLCSGQRTAGTDYKSYSIFYSFISQDTKLYSCETLSSYWTFYLAYIKKKKKKISPSDTLGNVNKLSGSKIDVIQFITRADVRRL